MSELTVRRQIRRYNAAGEVAELHDQLINEHRLTIRLEGENFIQAVLSPALLEEFVLGFLLTRGLIEKRDDLLSLEIKNNTASVERAPRLRGSLPQLSILESTGTRNVRTDQAHAVHANQSGSMLSVPAGVLIDSMRLLSEMPLYSGTGGTHCAILFSPAGESIISAEDIGRHNSVDKVIGGGLRKGVDFASSWLGVSGRLPADMVYKAVPAGIPLIASVSAPTSEGVKMGEMAGITVIGFARHERFNCYSHPERIG